MIIGLELIPTCGRVLKLPTSIQVSLGICRRKARSIFPCIGWTQLQSTVSQNGLHGERSFLRGAVAPRGIYQDRFPQQP